MTYDFVLSYAWDYLTFQKILKAGNVVAELNE